MRARLPCSAHSPAPQLLLRSVPAPLLLVSSHSRFDLMSEIQHACDLCGKGFSAAFNLYKHVRQVHKQEPLTTPVRSRLPCPLCPEIRNHKTRHELHVHLRQEHELEVTTSQHMFETMEGESGDRVCPVP